MTEISKILKLDGKKKTKQARFSEDFSYIIDSDGESVDFDDPRVIYVIPEPRDPYGRLITMAVYETYNRNIRMSKETDADILQYGKRICSGRECLASVGIAGAVLKDIVENREEDEITIYRTSIEQHGPCQNGAWPILWETFEKRLNLKNAIFYASPNYRNKYLGLSTDLFAWENIYFQIGHYLSEAKNSLQCLASNKSMALQIFEDTTMNFVTSLREDRKKIRTGLVKWAKEIRKIPLKADIEEIPKVLIFGGLNLLFDHYPVEQFFLDSGIIPKVADLADTTIFILGEIILRFGFKRGYSHPREQFDESLINYESLDEKGRREADKAIRNRKKMEFFHSQCKTFRRIIGKSGLLIDKDCEVIDLLEKGDEFITTNSCTETPLITGRYIHSLECGVYDGLVNLGTFNCQPAMNSQAIIRPLANKNDIPYAAIDCEGPWISTNQRRLLETIAIQAKRVRENKNKLKAED
ncbi:MAG: hypothetical protein ACW986_16685 [Promethearchaeota archaeon]|jgi:predicted nucleotide-binding protein (sugar kinase/HSP70/actin superfamily)